MLKGARIYEGRHLFVANTPHHILQAVVLAHWLTVTAERAECFLLMHPNSPSSATWDTAFNRWQQSPFVEYHLIPTFAPSLAVPTKLLLVSALHNARKWIVRIDADHLWMGNDRTPAALLAKSAIKCKESSSFHLFEDGADAYRASRTVLRPSRNPWHVVFRRLFNVDRPPVGTIGFSDAIDFWALYPEMVSDSIASKYQVRKIPHPESVGAVSLLRGLADIYMHSLPELKGKVWGNWDMIVAADRSNSMTGPLEHGAETVENLRPLIRNSSRAAIVYHPREKKPYLDMLNDYEAFMGTVPSEMILLSSVHPSPTLVGSTSTVLFSCRFWRSDANPLALTLLLGDRGLERLLKWIGIQSVGPH